MGRFVLLIMPEVMQDEEDVRQQPLPPADLGPEVPDFSQMAPPPAAPVAPAAPAPMVAPRPVGRTVTMPLGQDYVREQQIRVQRQQNEQEAAYLKSIYQRAQNIQQAEKDVSSARRMLGMLKADREIKSGVPVEKAMWNNMQYFVQPGSAASLKAFAPTPQPRVTNFPGIPTPVIIDPTGRPHFVPRASMPQPEFKATVEEIAPGIKAAKLGPNHYQLIERPQIKGSLSALVKTQIQLWRDRIRDLRASIKGAEGTEPEAIRANSQIAALEKQIMEAAAGETEAPTTGAKKRLKWNATKGDFE